MSLRDRIKKKSADLVRRETITLPDIEEDVVVRGLMFGEKERAAELSGRKQSLTLVALVVEDPETGKQLWNPGSRDDLEEIAALSIGDTEAIVGAMNRLSTGKAKEVPEATGSSPSPSSDSESEGAP